MVTETQALSNPLVLSHEELGVDLAAEIAGQQQAIVPAAPTIPVPTIPVPEEVDQLQPIIVGSSKIAPVSATSNQNLTTLELIKREVEKSGALSDQISGELQANLDVRKERADATADAITTMANADRVIALQTQTEANRIEEKRRRVFEEVNSEENQSRLITQYNTQNSELQAALDARQKEAEGGGIGYLLKSMLNMEIYGTPGGRTDIAINAMSNETNATLSEIQGINTALTAFEKNDKATQDLITAGTIHAGQQKITAQAQLDLDEARQLMLKDNMEVMQMLTTLQGGRLASLNAYLNAENSMEAREDRKITRVLQAEGLQIRRDQLELSRIGMGLDNQYKVLRNAVAAGEHGIAAKAKLEIKTMQTQFDALTLKHRENLATSEDRMSFISGQLQTQEAQLDSMVWELKNKKDLSDPIRQKLELDIIAARERIVGLKRENKIEETLGPLRIQQFEQNLVLTEQQERLQELRIMIESGTAEEKLAAVRQKALLEADVAETTRISVEQGAAAIGTAQLALFGYQDDLEARKAAVSETGDKGTKYDILENIGVQMASGNGLVLGDTTFKAWTVYNALTADGTAMRDLPFVESLKEVNENLERRYALNPGEEGALTRPSDLEEAAANFNSEAASYMNMQAVNVDWKDQSNPLALDQLSILEKKAPRLLEDPLYKIIKATGQQEPNPERMVDIALSSIGTEGGVNIEQAAAGLALIHNSGKFNSDHFQYGLGAGGFIVPNTFNVRLPKPNPINLSRSHATFKLHETVNPDAVTDMFPSVTGDAAKLVTELNRDKRSKTITINAMDQTQWLAYLVTRLTDRRATGTPISSKEGAE